MRNPVPTDGHIYLNLFNQHWTRSILPGITRSLRLYSDFSPLNHSTERLLELLRTTHPRPAGFLGIIHKRDTALRQILADRGIPAVNISSAQPPVEIPGVTVDNRAVGRMAAEHLLELGPRCFAYLDVGNNSMSQLRYQGFRDRIRKTYPNTAIPRLGGAKEEFIPNLLALPRPAALFCATDNRARAAAKVALSQGLKVPHELAILGVDNDPYECEMTRVPLSSVAIPFEKIGARAIELLLTLIDGKIPSEPTIEIAPTHVEIRLSSDPMVYEDELVNRAIRLARHPDQPDVNVARLVKALGVSRRTLEMRFRKAGAGTVLNMIQEVRLQQAAALLKETRLTVAEIARKVGMIDLSRFGKLFRQRFGQPPGQFRKSES